MTFAFPRPWRRTSARSHHPERPRVDDISVVVPVRDNWRGIERLAAWWDRLPPNARPRELIVVDDGSQAPVPPMSHGVRVLRIAGLGPAAARNAGWRAATGSWIAFTDSDCVPDPGWPAAFSWGWHGEVATQGRVRPMSDDALSLFYDAQQILRPMAWTRDGRPGYLISANAIIWREALVRLGGFDEQFHLAAGEDVDLGFRLAEVGRLRWCDEASVAHDFEPSIAAFIRRFARYGRGNRLLAAKCAETFASQIRPRPFVPRSGHPRDYGLALVAFASLAVGWALQSEGRTS